MNTHDVPFLNQVLEEYNRASSMYEPFNSAHEGFAVLKEEVDELWDEVKKNPHKSPTAIKTDPERNIRVHKEAMRAEAIQVAAMALRFLRDI